MNPTAYLVAKVHRRAAKYAAIYDVAPPKVYTDRGEWNRNTDSAVLACHIHILGKAKPAWGAVFINVEAHKTMAQMDETIAHEMVHMRWPDMPHGAEFNDRISRGMAGERFPRPKPAHANDGPPMWRVMVDDVRVQDFRVRCPDAGIEEAVAQVIDDQTPDDEDKTISYEIVDEEGRAYGPFHYAPPVVAA